MNKSFRLVIPFVGAILVLLAGARLVEASAASTPSQPPPNTTAKTGGGYLGEGLMAEGELLVTTLEDELNQDGDCSLREAVEAANTNAPVDACGAGEVLTDTVTFEVVGMITVTSQLSVTAGGPLVVDGEEEITISGGGTTRVWWMGNGSRLTLKNLIVTQGYDAGEPWWGLGGGLYNDMGVLSVIQCEFIENWSHEKGGGIYSVNGTITVSDSTFYKNSAGVWGGYGGGIYIQGGTATILRSTFRQNLVKEHGGALRISGAAVNIQDSYFYSNIADYQGGGIYSSGYLTIENSRFSGHWSNAIFSTGTLAVTNSTFASNSGFTGGAIYAGVVMIVDSTFSYNWGEFNGGALSIGGGTIINSTFSDNASGLDGGGGIFNYGTLVILNNTFYGNSTDGSGGGISNQGNIVLINTIVANSLLGGDCYGSITDGGHNIDSDGTCGLDPANGSMPNTDPALGPLQNNGGPTLTHALLWGSPAIDAGDDAQCPETDQRGVLRPQDGDNDGWAVCDIGSYEVERSQVSPNLVGISGSLEGMVDRTYTFTATVEPVSTTLWLTYTWQASGQLPVTHTNERTDTVSYTWDNPGAQHITITASNDFGAVMDTHVITITDQPIESLTANNDSPNLLREVTTLSATITSGTNVVYTWDFGDGEVGEGEVVTHTYAAEGVYTATVSAMNSVSSLSETTVVTITVSAPTYWEYLPLVFKPPAAANPVHEGIATYYDATGDGACMFGPSPDDLMVAAMNAEEYDNAGVCGAYVHVIGPQGEVTVRIVDLCPECLAGHLDLSREAFALIAELAEGRVDITWQVVSPELAGPIAYHLKDGSNQWWTAVQVRNHRNPVAKLEYLDESGMWVAVPRTAYNYFVQTDPGMGEGPYTFRVTDWYGNVLVDSGIPHVEDGTVDGSAQFPPGP